MKGMAPEITPVSNPKRSPPVAAILAITITTLFPFFLFAFIVLAGFYCGSGKYTHFLKRYAGSPLFIFILVI